MCKILAIHIEVVGLGECFKNTVQNIYIPNKRVGFGFDFH